MPICDRKPHNKTHTRPTRWISGLIQWPAWLGLIALLQLPVAAQTQQWLKQLGTPTQDSASDVAVDTAGNVYVTGDTRGSLAGNHAGNSDIWFSKYDKNGNLIWQKQAGTARHDFSSGIAVDNSGNIYLTGEFDSGTKGGYMNWWVAKYSSNGTLVWRKQMETAGYGSSYDVGVDPKGNVYIAGKTGRSLESVGIEIVDAWIAKYSPNGALLWQQELGSSEYDTAYAIAVDTSGNAYIAGETHGNLASPGFGGDGWVAKYNTAGTLLWKQQFGAKSQDMAWGVAVDGGGHVYVTGQSYTPDATDGEWSSLLLKYNSRGQKLWQQTLKASRRGNSGSVDNRPNRTYTFGVQSQDVTLDKSGNIYITGMVTLGSVSGTNAGGTDTWLAKYRSNGTQQWIKQWGTANDEVSGAIAVDASGNIYTTGNIDKPIQGTTDRDLDAWVAKYK